MNVHDRCDRCSSQAYVWVNTIYGDLFFCGHHYAKHADALAKVAIEVIDERSCIPA